MTDREALYAHCELCPRRCGVNRLQQAGACGMTVEMKIAKAMLHPWEEPCLASGEGKAGAVFFSGCTLRCAYCQNYKISHQGFGVPVTAERLAGIMRELTQAGADCIDLVTGTQFIPSILDALDLYRPPVPVVWNSGGYERPEILWLLEGYVQIYLPDLKHVSDRIASACTGRGDYFRFASAALSEMHRQTGPNQTDEKGLLRRGMLVRHLVLPGASGDAVKVLDYVAEQLPGVPVSLMRQYTPIPECTVKGLGRRVTDREYGRALDEARHLGLTGYFQEEDSAQQTYIPDFDLSGVLKEGP